MGIGCIVTCAVVLTLAAIILGSGLDPSGMISLMFTITVMGAFILYAVLRVGQRLGDAKQPEDPRNPDDGQEPEDPEDTEDSEDLEDSDDDTETPGDPEEAEGPQEPDGQTDRPQS